MERVYEIGVVIARAGEQRSEGVCRNRGRKKGRTKTETEVTEGKARAEKVNATWDGKDPLLYIKTERKAAQHNGFACPSTGPNSIQSFPYSHYAFLHHLLSNTVHS